LGLAKENRTGQKTRYSKRKGIKIASRNRATKEQTRAARESDNI